MESFAARGAPPVQSFAIIISTRVIAYVVVGGYRYLTRGGYARAHRRDGVASSRRQGTAVSAIIAVIAPDGLKSPIGRHVANRRVDEVSSLATDADPADSSRLRICVLISAQKAGQDAIRPRLIA